MGVAESLRDVADVSLLDCIAGARDALFDLQKYVQLTERRSFNTIFSWSPGGRVHTRLKGSPGMASWSDGRLSMTGHGSERCV